MSNLCESLHKKAAERFEKIDQCQKKCTEEKNDLLVDLHKSFIEALSQLRLTDRLKIVSEIDHRIFKNQTNDVQISESENLLCSMIWTSLKNDTVNKPDDFSTGTISKKADLLSQATISKQMEEYRSHMPYSNILIEIMNSFEEEEKSMDFYILPENYAAIYANNENPDNTNMNPLAATEIKDKLDLLLKDSICYALHTIYSLDTLATRTINLSFIKYFNTVSNDCLNRDRTKETKAHVCRYQKFLKNLAVDEGNDLSTPIDYFKDLVITIIDHIKKEKTDSGATQYSITLYKKTIQITPTEHKELTICPKLSFYIAARILKQLIYSLNRRVFVEDKMLRELSETPIAPKGGWMHKFKNKFANDKKGFLRIGKSFGSNDFSTFEKDLTIFEESMDRFTNDNLFNFNFMMSGIHITFENHIQGKKQLELFNTEESSMAG